MLRDRGLKEINFIKNTKYIDISRLLPCPAANAIPRYYRISPLI